MANAEITCGLLTIRTTFSRGKENSVGEEQVALDRDLVLWVEPAEPRKPHAKVARESDRTPVAMFDARSVVLPGFATASAAAQ
jgi:hypothetical protein